jgi:hypothetical protein
LVSTARVLKNKTALALRNRRKNLENAAEFRQSAKVGLMQPMAAAGLIMTEYQHMPRQCGKFHATFIKNAKHI